MAKDPDGYLALEDGRTFRGRPFGARAEVAGEVVFNTSMTGYQEILTDPSYRAQIVCMTYPHIGNTGANRFDPEAGGPQAAGLVCRELCRVPSSWRSEEPLDAYLARHGIPGIEEVDTRALVRHIREKGAMRGVIGRGDPARLVDMARSAPGMVGRDLVLDVTCRASYPWTEPLDPVFFPHPRAPGRLAITVVDYGVKRSILRALVAEGCRVTVVPAETSGEEILAGSPSGVVLSNGPGDPAACTYAVRTARHLLGRLPILGICLGHQILGIALGGRTFKLKFGHRGGNHPVKDLVGGAAVITSHNHGFAVDPGSLPATARPTYRSLFDGTLEGFEDPTLRVAAVQFHPEAAPGPHDASTIFRTFVEAAARHEPRDPEGAPALGSTGRAVLEPEARSL